MQEEVNEKTVVPVYYRWKSDSPLIETGNDAFSGSNGERKSRESKKTAGKGSARQRIIMESRV